MSKKLFFPLLDGIVPSISGTDPCQVHVKKVNRAIGVSISVTDRPISSGFLPPINSGFLPVTCKLFAPKSKKMEPQNDLEQRELPKVPDIPPPPAPGNK